MELNEQPLDPQSWVESIARLLARAKADSDPQNFARHLRSAFHLSRVAPAILGEIFAAEATEAEYEEYLAADDLYKASIELLNPALMLVLVKPDGSVKLEIHAPAFGAKGEANDVFPRGIVLAWAKCALQVAERAMAGDDLLSRRGPRTPRSVPHPPSTSH